MSCISAISKRVAYSPRHCQGKGKGGTSKAGASICGAVTVALLRADLGTHARGKDAVATVVVDKLRRRMRQNGYRAHLTLQARSRARVVVALGAPVGEPHSASCGARALKH